MLRRAGAVSLFAALGAGAAYLVVACLDVDTQFVPPRDGAAADGAPCLTCLSQPSDQGGCDDTLAACEDDPRCDPVYVCMAADGCLDRPTIDDKIACTLPCLQEAGIVSTTDPTVDTLLNVVRCGQAHCATQCNLGDAGLDFDAL